MNKKYCKSCNQNKDFCKSCNQYGVEYCWTHGKWPTNKHDVQGFCDQANEILSKLNPSSDIYEYHFIKGQDLWTRFKHKITNENYWENARKLGPISEFIENEMKKINQIQQKL